MNQFDIFIKKIDEVFNLMILGKLQEETDDTFLEKLLGVISDGYRLRSLDRNVTNKKLRYESCSEKTDYLKYILKKTSIWKLFKKALESIQGLGLKLSLPVEVFSIHLLGAFADNKDIFLMLNENESIMKIFFDICKENCIPSFSPSITAAVLSTLTRIALHQEGLTWLTQEGIVEIAFSSFAANSYYVRKEAINFLTVLLTTWSTSENLHIKDSMQLAVKDAVNGILERLICGLNVSSGPEKKFPFDCCISVLKQSMEKSSYMNLLLCEGFHLSGKILNSLKFSENVGGPPESIIELLAECLDCSKSCDVMMEVVHILLQHKFVASVLVLVSSFLSRQNCIEKAVNENFLKLVMWPVLIISKNSMPSPQPEEFVQMLAYQMSEKNTCVRLVRLSISAVSKLLPIMDAEMLSCIVNASLDILQNTMTKQALSSFQVHVSKCKKVQLSLYQLLCTLSDEPVSQTLTEDIKLQLLEALISISENTTMDSNFNSQTLKMISKLITIESQINDYLPKELKKRLVSMIQRKLQDTQWSVIDSSLEVISHMVLGCKDDELWQEWICILSIHTAVWDVAAANEAEGYVRASALRVFISFCLCPFIWEQLKSRRGADEETIISFLCKLSNDPDVFVQRESILSLFQWMQSSSVNVPSRSNAAIFKTLTTAVRYSLDWDTKLIALRAWQWVAEKELSCFSLPTQQSNVQETLHSLCNIGYGSSVLSALSDHDRTVQHEAAQALLTLRQTLLDLGLNEMSLLLNDSNLSCDKSSDNETESTVLLDYEPTNYKASPLSQAERDAAMEEVLDINTSGQICKVIRPTDNSYSLSECTPKSDDSLICSPFEAKLTLSCPMKVFWKKLWSLGIESVISTSMQSSDVYTNDPVALLDDIIASKVQDTFVHCTEYQHADCY